MWYANRIRLFQMFEITGVSLIKKVFIILMSILVILMGWMMVVLFGNGAAGDGADAAERANVSVVQSEETSVPITAPSQKELSSLSTAPSHNDASVSNSDQSQNQVSIQSSTSSEEVAEESSISVNEGETTENGVIVSGDGYKVYSSSSKLLDVPYVCQLPDYPTGCEGISAVMALNYAGMAITPEEFFDHCLTMTYYPFDPDLSYCGNPRDDSGFGCYAPVIAEAMNRALSDRDDCQAYAVYGKTVDELCEQYINKNVPVVIWASENMDVVRPSSSWMYNGKLIQWYVPEHCLVLVGYDEEYYYFNDPMQNKNISYSKAAVNDAYTAMGMQCVVITRANNRVITENGT